MYFFHVKSLFHTAFDRHKCSEKIVNIFLHIILAYVLGAQKNRLIKTVLLSTQNICFGWEIRKLFFCYTLLSKGLLFSCLFSADWFIYGESQGRNYVGSIGQTSKNITCLSWNDPRVLKYSYQAQHFPDGQIPGPYCRNPRDPQSGAFASGPWCFIERGTRKPQFSYCDQLMQTGMYYITFWLL